MANRDVDPSELMRDAARSMPDADEGTSCTQTSFKVGGKAFLYVGEQGGRFKAMFKLRDSIAQAEEMAADAPDDVQVNKQGWVTARFSAKQPLATRVWKKWLKESYGLAAGK
jgi:predicted DNA-binding protein (MmcQ/YjbR family)